MSEFDRKVQRAADAARIAGLGGVLLASPPGFSWITGGASNRIDITRDPGAGAVLVAADGRATLIANHIEMPRLRDALWGHPLTCDPLWEPIELPWTEERADARAVVGLASRFVGGAQIGADAPVVGATRLDGPLSAIRTPLLDDEVARYRALGRDVGPAVTRALSRCAPGQTEYEVAAQVAAEVHAIGARPHVLLVGADDRLARFRHPVPSDHVWRRVVMVAVCAERGGLVAALSRIITAGPIDQHLRARTDAAMRVFAALVTATTPGATGADLFAVARDGYAANGFAGEEREHHQGGAIGYRARDWVAHPASKDRVAAPQAFAWNPSIAGTKIEDTILVTDRGHENITASDDWPTVTVNGVRISDIWAR